ncbi:hypothetical protein Vafri_9981 [Volvox africanus]|uniref:AAA+ ATPase domain-containing protein n=1 Tax=Volvox africanus TaxID=51714 RepID=A0A8J4F315_9CHLO|nr:hypothetical protein Vafri_9981 [Volvox africanus]
MDALLQLRHLHFYAEGCSVGSEQQQAKALQLKCFLSSVGAPEFDPSHGAADALLDTSASARRERLWDAVMYAASLDKDFCILEGSLANLDLPGAVLKGCPLLNIGECMAAAREASAQTHQALLDFHQRHHQEQQQQQQQQQQKEVATVQRTSIDCMQPPGPGQAPGSPSGVTAAAAAAVGGGPGSGAQQNYGALHCGGGGGGGVGQSHPRPGPSFRPPVPPTLQQPQDGSAVGIHAPQVPPNDGGHRWSGGSGSGSTGNGPSRWAMGKRPALMDVGASVDEDCSSGPGGGAGGGPQAGGFRTARAQLVADSVRKGQAPPTFSNQVPRTGLTRPQKKQQTGGGGAGGGSNVRGFVPPFVARGLEGPPAAGGGGKGEPTDGDVDSPYPPRLLEMLSERNLLSYGPEGNVVVPEPLAKLDPKIIDNVFNEVLDRSASIGWSDIAGQDAAKRLVQEMVVWPMLNPQLFRGARAPPRGLLLFGPPGTGKTLIGKAVAANISATFFSISASSLTSKWIGEGEKMVRALFALAGCLQPSVIFIDEIDSLLSARKAEGEHEASRRLKTEMLVQMDGCDPGSSERRVLVIGATNRPEELDEAARRRMPKQLYIPLPCTAARYQMLVNTFRQGCTYGRWGRGWVIPSGLLNAFQYFPVPPPLALASGVRSPPLPPP